MAPVKKAEPKAEEMNDSRKPEKKEGKKKSTTKKLSPKTSVFIEYSGRKVETKDILETARIEFEQSNPGIEVRTIEVYVKPEESAAYYVVNGVGSQEYKVAL